jgi:AraC-like DNA-binding protein
MPRPSSAPEKRRRQDRLQAKVEQRKAPDPAIHDGREQPAPGHARKRRARGEADTGAQFGPPKRDREHRRHGDPEPAIDGADFVAAGRGQVSNIELARHCRRGDYRAHAHQQSQDQGEKERRVMEHHHVASMHRLPGRDFHEATALVSIRGARASYVGPRLDLAPHRNAVAVVAIGLEQSFELAILETRAEQPAYARQRAALIPPGRLHHLRSQGRMAFLYLDALSDDYSALQDKVPAHVAAALIDSQPGPASGEDLFGRLGLPKRPPVDPRIAGILRAIDADPDAFECLDDASRAAKLSASRCRDLIRAAAGVPFRRYRLWRRMARVCRELSQGRSLTTAAHAAGFASSAHLSEAFRQMFGLAPSMLLRAGVAFDVD